MILTICYNDSCEDFNKELSSTLSKNYVNIEVNAYNESFYNERRKAFKTKGGYSARMTPFVLLTDDNKKYIKAFYTEDKSCNVDNIINFLNSINNESTSN